MDDLIMEVTICQDKHRVDRSAPPKVRLSGFLSQDGRTTIYQGVLQKVVLLRLDRNRELSYLESHLVCLKAHAGRLDPAGKRDLARIMGRRMNRVSVSWGTWVG